MLVQSQKRALHYPAVHPRPVPSSTSRFANTGSGPSAPQLLLLFLTIIYHVLCLLVHFEVFFRTASFTSYRKNRLYQRKQMRDSETLVPVTLSANGIPWTFAIRWCLQSDFRLSAGDSPVWRHQKVLELKHCPRQPVTNRSCRLLAIRKQCFLESLSYASIVPLLGSSPTTHPRPHPISFGRFPKESRTSGQTSYRAIQAL